MKTKLPIKPESPLRLSDFAKLTKDVRKHMGLSQSEFAKVMGVTTQAISLWERSKRYPAAKHLSWMLKYLEKNL